jgi:negative regulator of flagellin synthesis FlgM
MKITDPKSVAQPLEKSTGKPGARNGAVSAPVAGESIKLSPMSSQLSALETQLGASPEFDAGKVAAIKQAIRDGQLTINPGAIADKLVSSVEEFLRKPH